MYRVQHSLQGASGCLVYVRSNVVTIGSPDSIIVLEQIELGDDFIGVQRDQYVPDVRVDFILSKRGFHAV